MTETDKQSQKAAATADRKSDNSLKEIVSVLVQAIILAVIIRSFLIQPFVIPSGSMKPTLLEGDYVFVTKWSYGYSRHSLPFSPPIFDGRIWSGEPQRGDVIVFKFPGDNRTDYIKRLIGLPGDQIQLKDSTVFVNGQPIERLRQGTFEGVLGGLRVNRPIIVERMDNDRTYQTVDNFPGSQADSTGVYEVPQGHYFFMGDNRDHSEDSRFPAVGFVPAENLVGKARFIFLSLENNTPAWQVWKWPSAMRWDRLFTGL